jgi:hypothetical protein
MLEVSEHVISHQSDQLLDLDLLDSGQWVGITKNEILTSYTRVPSPDLRFPLIRFIDQESVVVVEARAKTDDLNGYIINPAGETKYRFYAGDAIEDVVVTQDYLVATYFDESFGGTGVESGRLAVFDHNGSHLFGYMDEFGGDAVDLFDCYACTLVKGNQILFFCYTEFPLVILDLEDRTQKILNPPHTVFGSHSITKLGNKIYFHGTYEDKFGIYEWQIGSDSSTRVAEHPSFSRGLPLGRFLSTGESGYSIIDIKRSDLASFDKIGM